MTADSPKGPESEVLSGLLRGMSRKVTRLRRSWRSSNASLSKARREYKELLRLMANAAGITRMTVKPEQVTEVILSRRAATLRLRAERDEWKRAAEAEAALLDQEQAGRRAEVSRLREQLAQALVLPQDAEVQIAQAIEDYYMPLRDNCWQAYDETSAGQAHQAIRLMRSWGASSSEAPQPVQHSVRITKLLGSGQSVAVCPACREGMTGADQQAEDWRDQHEADTLRPQVRFDNPSARVSAVEGKPPAPTPLVSWERIDEGRPADFGRLAPRSGVELIADERARQVAVEGWTPDHDATHNSDDLAMAAVCYALPAYARHPVWAERWPWAPEFWKPNHRNRVRELMKAGALVAAEIDRIQAQDAAQAARSEATPKVDACSICLTGDEHTPEDLAWHHGSPSLPQGGGTDG